MSRHRAHCLFWSNADYILICVSTWSTMSDSCAGYFTCEHLTCTSYFAAWNELTMCMTCAWLWDHLWALQQIMLMMGLFHPANGNFDDGDADKLSHFFPPFSPVLHTLPGKRRVVVGNCRSGSEEPKVMGHIWHFGKRSGITTVDSLR